MKFNNPAVDMSQTTNYEDAPAYNESPELALYTLACTSLMEDQFYRPTNQVINELTELVKQCNPEFVAKLAIYARKEMNLRSLPVAMAVTLCLTHKHPSVSKCISGVIQRVDEITEILSYFAMVNQNATKEKPLTKIPSIIKKAIKSVFESGRFDEYQYAKYNRDGSVKLKDALFLTHPSPKGKENEEELSHLWKKIADNKLETPYTWETELSKGKDRKETWESLISSEKVGYMATLRNLRNILNANVSDGHIDTVARFVGSDQVYKSKQFPFRFWSAYRELKELPQTEPREKFIYALETAIRKSIKSYPDFKGNVLIACDTSGSMNDPLSKKSSLKLFEVGLVFGALLQKELPRAAVGQFAETFEMLNTREGVLDTADDFIKQQGNVGYSTNGHLAIDHISHHKITVDQVIMFTDCQPWDNVDSYIRSHKSASLQNSWMHYTANINKNAELWLFDLSGYGTTPIRIQGNVHLIGGWNDRIFDAVNRIKGGQSTVDIIMSTNL